MVPARLTDGNLWARLRDCPLTLQSGTLADAVERETGHGAPRVTQIIAEYRRFLYLVAVGSEVLAPSRLVDKVWHLHLADTAGYDGFCQQIIGRVIRHQEGRPRPFDDPAYAATLAAHAREFGAPAFWRVWPTPQAERWRARMVAAALSCAALGIGMGLMGHAPVALVLFVLGFGLIVLHAVVSPWNVVAGAGGGCGGSSGDSDGGDGGCGGGGD